MAEDFCSAAFRHFHDADILFRVNGRFDNAGYLAGYVVECGLKLLLECEEQITGKSLGHDLVNLATQALRFSILLSPGIQRYDVDGDTDVAFALTRWSPELRYEGAGHISQLEANQLLKAGQAVLDMIVIPLILDGVVEMPK